jgi:transposase
MLPGRSGSTKAPCGTGVRAARQAEQQATAPGSVTETEREELKRLRKEVIELQTDKEILKRAAAYFARETIR